MKTITCVIVDDERLARASLRKKLLPFKHIEVIGEATSIASAIHAVNELKPDLIFLDIQLSDGTGFDLIDKIDFKGKIVFVTAFDAHAIKAFEVKAIDYLLKPVARERLKLLIQRLDSEAEEGRYEATTRYNYDDRIMIEQKGEIHFILVSSILLVNSAKDYTLVFTHDTNKYLVLTSMNEWEQRLPREHFFRVHRTAIINLNYIEVTKRLGATAEIKLKNYPKPIRISRSYFKVLRERFIHR